MEEDHSVMDFEALDEFQDPAPFVLLMDEWYLPEQIPSVSPRVPSLMPDSTYRTLSVYWDHTGRQQVSPRTPRQSPDSGLGILLGYKLREGDHAGAPTGIPKGA
ncbi:GL26957 [Drosophila persimilis]|uniref:GL26957 n=1 Tax=Drosophila persimilis TaxID=7234 RepID=B4HCB5_DROPE|nr:GL26957 [Drosophila persimilis]